MLSADSPKNNNVISHKILGAVADELVAGKYVKLRIIGR